MPISLLTRYWREGKQPSAQSICQPSFTLLSALWRPSNSTAAVREFKLPTSQIPEATGALCHTSPSTTDLGCLAFPLTFTFTPCLKAQKHVQCSRFRDVLGGLRNRGLIPPTGEQQSTGTLTSHLYPSPKIRVGSPPFGGRPFISLYLSHAL